MGLCCSKQGSSEDENLLLVTQNRRFNITSIQKTVDEMKGEEFKFQREKYANSTVQELLEKLGDFRYDDYELERRLGDCEKRDVVITETGARYDGEWLKGTQIRQGRGKVVWPDGSTYEGYWANNKANGKGRLIHNNGNYYEGQC